MIIYQLIVVVLLPQPLGIWHCRRSLVEVDEDEDVDVDVDEDEDVDKDGSCLGGC